MLIVILTPLGALFAVQGRHIDLVSMMYWRVGPAMIRAVVLKVRLLLSPGRGQLSSARGWSATHCLVGVSIRASSASSVLVDRVGVLLLSSSW